MIKKSRKFLLLLSTILLAIGLLGLTAQAAEKASISKASVSVMVKKTAKISMKNTGKAKVKWSISNKKIATIKANGKSVTITGKKAGSCTLRAKVSGKTYKCKVTVKKEALSPTKIYLSGDLTTDYMAETICNKILKPTMTKEEQMKRLYEYVVKLSIHYSSKKQVGKINFKLNSEATKQEMAAYESKVKELESQGKVEYGFYGSYEFLLTGMGDCGTVASAYQTLLGHIGVKSMLIDGYSVGGLHHWWNIVLYNGKYYFADADAENDNYTRLIKKNGNLGYYFYMKGSKTMKDYGFKFNISKPKVEKEDAGL